jgi:hypothetical protein
MLGIGWQNLIEGGQGIGRFDVCSWHFSDIEAAASNVRFRGAFRTSAKVLNSTEGAHIET